MISLFNLLALAALTALPQDKYDTGYHGVIKHAQHGDCCDYFMANIQQLEFLTQHDTLQYGLVVLVAVVVDLKFKVID